MYDLKFFYFLLIFLNVFVTNIYAEENSSQLLECPDCNLIMISLSNVSAENMSLYGYERITTPNLSEWAQRAVVFDKAFTQTSWTLPVGTSLFTSLYPYTHKVLDHYVDNILDKHIQTLPEILRKQGYKTAAFTGGLDYHIRFGHMRGFEYAEMVTDTTKHPAYQGNFNITFQKALNWIDKNSKDKFFLFLHNYDTHCPFNPPQEFKGKFSNPKDVNADFLSKHCFRGYQNSEKEGYETYYYDKKPKKVILLQKDVDYLRDLYDEEILALDKLLGEFLNSLDEKIVDKTVIIVFSDHGEMFGKHGRFGRAGATRGTLYDDVLHIPLIMKLPNNFHKRVDGLVQIIDIMPTVLDMLSISYDETKIQGKNLSSLILKNMEVNDYVFTGTIFGGEVHDAYYLKGLSRCESIRNKTWKLIHEIIFSSFNPKEKQVLEETFELYNLKSDSEELNNVVDQNPEVGKLLKQKLNVWRKNTQMFLDSQSQSLDILKNIREDIKTRGYW